MNQLSKDLTLKLLRDIGQCIGRTVTLADSPSEMLEIYAALTRNSFRATVMTAVQLAAVLHGDDFDGEAVAATGAQALASDCVESVTELAANAEWQEATGEAVKYMRTELRRCHS